MAEPCTWYERDLPDRSGVAKYTVAIKAPDTDPEPLSRKAKHAIGSGFEAWRTDLLGTDRQWAARIARLLCHAPHSLTFNAITLHLTGLKHGADSAMGRAPEAGLWLAVERGLIWWANVNDHVRFARRPMGWGGSPPRSAGRQLSLF